MRIRGRLPRYVRLLQVKHNNRHGKRMLNFTTQKHTFAPIFTDILHTDLCFEASGGDLALSSARRRRE